VSEDRLAEIDAFIDELTIDAYGDEEQLTGFLTGAEDALQAPEPAAIVGVSVEVVKVDEGPDLRRGLIAVCEHDGARYEISLADLTFGPDSQLGLIVAAYRRWLGCAP
jgi:uncharacterized protein YigA (DUF484 family)